MNYNRVPNQVRTFFLEWLRQLKRTQPGDELLPETLWLNQCYVVTLESTSETDHLYVHIGLMDKQYYLEFENLNEVIRYFEDGHVETVTKL